MPITLDEPTTGGGTPVVKRQALGQTWKSYLIRYEQRDVLKEDKPVLKDNGKPRQELVVHVVTHPSSTMEVGLGDDVGPPTKGQVCRMILRGKAFSDWIDAKRSLGTFQVGDCVEQALDTAQAYDSHGKPKGGAITDQEEVVAHRMKGTSVGVYGPLTVRRATADEAEYVALAEAAYMQQTAKKLDDPNHGAQAWDEEPFVRDAGEWMPGAWGAYPESVH